MELQLGNDLPDNEESARQNLLEQFSEDAIKRRQQERLSRQLNVPANIVGANPQRAELEAQFPRDQVHEQLKKSPFTNEMLNDKSWAQELAEDFQPMVKLEGALDWLKQSSIINRWLAVPRDVGNFRDVTKAQFESGWLEHDTNQRAYDELLAPGRTHLTKEEAAIYDALDDEAEALGNLGDKDRGLLTDMVGSAAKIVGQMIPGMLNSWDEATWGAAIGGELGLVAGGGPNPAGLALGVAGMGAGATSGFMTGLAEDTFKQEAAGVYRDLLSVKDDQGNRIDPEVMRNASLVVGVVNAGIDTLGAFGVAAPIKKSIQQWTTSAVKDALKDTTQRQVIMNFAKNYGLAWGSEVSTEVLQEVVSMAGQDLAKNMSVGDFETLTEEQWREQLFEIFSEVGKGMAVLALPGASINVHTDMQRMRRGKTDAEKLAQASEAANQMKLKQIDPERFTELMRDLGQSTGHQNVYVNPEGVERLYQMNPSAGNQGANGAMQSEAFKALFEDLPKARTEGRDVAIPFEAWMRDVAGTEQEKTLLPYSKFDADNLSLMESQNQDVQAEIRRLQEEMGNAADADLAVYNDIMGQFKTTTVSDSMADMYAVEVQAFYNVLSEKTGTPVDQLWAENPLNIQQLAPKGLREQTRRVDSLDAALDDLRAGSIPTEAEAFGESMLEYIARTGGMNDEGGELAARDVDKGRVGRNRIARKNSTRMLDGLTEELVEQGFLTNRDSNEFFAALDRELAGDRVTTPNAMNNDLAIRRSQLLQLEEELGRAGVDLQSMSNEDVRTFIESSMPKMGDDVLAQPTNNKAPDNAEASGQAGKVRYNSSGSYSLMQNSKEQSEKVKEQERWKRLLSVMDTKDLDFTLSISVPYALRSVGFTGKNLSVSKRRIGQIKKKHKDLPSDLLANLPELIQSPKFIYPHKDGGVTIILDGVTTAKNEPIAVGVRDGTISTITPQHHSEDKTGDERVAAQVARHLKNKSKLYAKDKKAIDDAMASQMPGVTEANSPIPYKLNKNVILGDEPVNQTNKKGPSKGDARGFFEGGSNTITLTPGADWSTFLHESAHFYLTVMDRIAEKNAAMAADLATLDDWFKSAPRAKDDKRSEWERRQELFASGFEAYHLRGEAPSNALRAIFQKFRLFLTRLYKNIDAIFKGNGFEGASLSPEAIDFMDRMLAGVEAVKAARDQAGVFTPLDLEALGATPEEVAEYRAMVAKENEAQEAALMAEVVKDYKAENKKWWDENIRKMQQTVWDELAETPAYRMRDFLYGDFTSSIPTRKLDFDMVANQFGRELARRFARERLTTRDGGMTPNQAATLFGFRDGFEAIEELSNTLGKQERRKKVNLEAEQRLKELAGDPMLDGSMADKAAAAVAGWENSTEKLFMEMKFLNRNARKGVKTPRAVYKETAQRIIASKPIEQVQPNTYRNQQRKSYTHVIKLSASGNYDLAAQAMHQVILNRALETEARNVRQEADKIVKRLNKLSKRQWDTKKVDPDYITQIKVLLSAYNLRKARKLPDGYLARVREFIKTQHEARPELIADHYLESITDWRNLTIENLQDLREAVENLLFVGTEYGDLKQKAYKAQAERLAAGIVDNRYKTPTEHTSSSQVAGFKKGFASVKAYLRKMQSLVLEADGWKEGGAFMAEFYNPLWDAQVLEIDRSAKEFEKLKALFEGHEDLFSNLMDNMRDLSEVTRRRTDTHIMTLADGRKRYLSRADRLALLLNWGNQGNRDALLSQEQRGMTEAEILKAIGTLTPKEVELAGEIWQYLDSFYPELARLEQKTKGVAPKKVKALPFQVRLDSGEVIPVAGGYYPLKADRDFSWRAESHSIEERAKKQLAGQTTSPQTRVGAANERVGFGGQDVDLNLAVIFQHTSEMIHDLTHREALYNADRLLRHPDVRGALTDSLGKQNVQAMSKTITRLAAGPENLQDLGAFERIMRYSRKMTSLGAMGYSISTAILNLTGIFPAANIVGRMNLMSAMVERGRSPIDTQNFIEERSVFMVNRAETINRDIFTVLRDMKANTTLNGLQRYAFWMMQQIDGTVSRTVWLAAYNKAMAEDSGSLTADQLEQNAIRYADQTVAETQGSGLRITLSAVEDTSEFMRVLTPMFSYFSAVHQMSVRIQGERATGQIGRFEFAMRMFTLFVMGAVVEEFFRGGAPDDEEPEEMAARYGLAVGSFVLGQYPLVRDAGGLIRYGMMFPTPTQSAIRNPLAALSEGWEQAFDDEAEFNKGSIRNLTGALPYTGIPTGAQVNRMLGHWYDTQQGDDFSLYKFLITGKEEDTDLERLFQ